VSEGVSTKIIRQLTNPAQEFSLFTETALTFQSITRNSF
jgi:hypothetical protein